MPYQLDKQFPVTIKIDEEDSFNADIFLFLITNSPSVGGFKKLVPEASITDSMLDLLLIKKTAKKELVEIFSKIITGQHIKHPGVLYKKASKISLTSSVGVTQLDLIIEKCGTFLNFSSLCGARRKAPGFISNHSWRN